MQIPDENKIPRAIRNEWFYMIARVCMILSVPVGGFFMQRMIAKADEISVQLTTQAMTLQLLSQRMDFQLKYDGEKIQDHDGRIRQLEKVR